MLDHELMVDRLAAGGAPARATDSELELQRWQRRKQEAMVAQYRQHMEALFADQALQAVRVALVHVTNAQGFRDAFVERQIAPLAVPAMTLAQLARAIDAVLRNFADSGAVERMHILLEGGGRGLLGLGRRGVAVTPVVHLTPLRRFYAKTGTNVGNGEGDGYVQFQLKNLFGGGESVAFDAVTGTKTRSLYLLNYAQPLFNRCQWMAEAQAYTNTRQLDWLGAEARVQGVTARVFSQFGGANHDLSVEHSWRVLSNVRLRAMAVAAQLGNDWRLLVLYNWRYDTRDNAHLPSRGRLVRLGLEYSGLLPACRFRFAKAVVEGQQAAAVGPSHRVIVTTRAGVLVPLGGGGSHVLDRFTLGGPNDVRLFALNGLGPKSFNSALGGNAFVSGGVLLVLRVPRLGADSGFRLHHFVNAGALAPLDDRRQWRAAAAQLRLALASCGVGVLYNHPMARFELNVVLPLVARERDAVRKGLQYGIGVSFL